MLLRLGTFNVWGLPEAFADDVSSRMRGVATRLHGLDLDILCLQEAWTDEVCDTLRSAALDAGFSVAGGGRSAGGLMVLSRLPIRSSRFENFHFRGDPERLSQGEFLGRKGFQTVTLEWEGRFLPVINTHLHARYRRARPQLNSAVRTAQLLQVIGALTDLEGTAVVGGDFNCISTDLEYRIFSGLTGSIELGQGSSFPTLSKTNYYKRSRTGEDKRIDYLFVRPASGVACRSTDAATLFAESERIRFRDRSLSDHYGFRASFEEHAIAMATSAHHSPLFDSEAFDLARNLLRIGREEADRRERVHFQFAGGWAAAAILAVGLRRHPAVDRRRFMRSAAGALALLALMPTVGYGTLARLDSDRKRDAFDDAQKILVQLEGHPAIGNA